MAGEEISAELKRFIHRTINSVEQLEILLFLMSNADHEWSVEEVAERVRLAPVAVRPKLAELHRAELLVQRDGSTAHYRYDPKSSALRDEVAESLDAAYKEGRDTLIQLIYSRPFDNIRVFADAFRIKRED